MAGLPDGYFFKTDLNISIAPWLRPLIHSLLALRTSFSPPLFEHVDKIKTRKTNRNKLNKNFMNLPTGKLNEKIAIKRGILGDSGKLYESDSSISFSMQTTRLSSFNLTTRTP